MKKTQMKLYLKRKELGLTQTELANSVGIGLSTIVKMEKEMDRCKISTVRDVVEALGCSLSVTIIDHENDSLSEKPL